MKKNLKITSNTLVWIIYIALLFVLWPHTTWAFSRFEPTEAGYFGVSWGFVLAAALAFAFEAALAVFTHKLARHIEVSKRPQKFWLRFSHHYLNAYGLGLFVAWAVSTLANLAHSVEFGQRLKIFDDWGIPFGVYAIAFGAILPLTSLLFARVLSNTVEAEQEENARITELTKLIAALKREKQVLEQKAAEAEQRANDTEQELNALVRLARKLFEGDKQEKIITIYEQWPNLPQRSIAIMAETSASTVNDVLKQLPNGKTNGKQ